MEFPKMQSPLPSFLKGLSFSIVSILLTVTVTIQQTEVVLPKGSWAINFVALLAVLMAFLAGVFIMKSIVLLNAAIAMDKIKNMVESNSMNAPDKTNIGSSDKMQAFRDLRRSKNEHTD